MGVGGLALACGPKAAKVVTPPAPPAPKKVLILGGTGFIGPHIVEALSAHGHTVTLFNRGKTHAELFPELEKLHGDRDGHLEALVGRQWDAVVDTSGFVPRIVKASAELLAPNVKQYVFISTISVYDLDKVTPGADEVSGPIAQLADATSEDVKKDYGALKARCEEAAEAAMPGRVTNIRPGLIVGPGDETDRWTYWPVRVARGGEVLAPGDGGDLTQLIDARDLAVWIVRCIEQGTVGVFNATGPADELTFRAMLDACKTATPASDATFTWVDAGFLDAQKVGPWGDLPAWVPGKEGAFLQIANAKAVGAGLTFRAVVDSARDTLAWWTKLPGDRRAKPRAGLTAERETAVLTAWHQKK